MVKIGRNDPCSCGSGKKRKRCCLAAHAPSGTRAATPDPSSQRRSQQLEVHALQDHYHEAMAAHRLDEAEAVARQLLLRFPAWIDGHERLAEVAAARNDHAAATRCYRQAALGMTPAEPNYDPAYVPYLLYRADVHARLARGVEPSHFDELADSVAGDLIRGDLDDVLLGIEDLLLRDPGHHVPIERRGQLLEIRGDLSGAARDFREAAALARARRVDQAHLDYLIRRADVIDPPVSRA
jgi:tetratricopeptide (TPR) repeat protein